MQFERICTDFFLEKIGENLLNRRYPRSNKTANLALRDPYLK